MRTALQGHCALQGAVMDAFADVRRRLDALGPHRVPCEVGTLASGWAGIARVHVLPNVGVEELLLVADVLSGLVFKAAGGADTP